MSQFRALCSEEISQLERQGCTCGDWSRVCVAAGFGAGRVVATHFSGDVRLGVFEKDVSFFGSLARPTGIHHATVHNCTIGDNVYIGHVRNYIGNYVVEDEAVIENVDLLAVDGESSFGNGTDVAAVNEAGGREIPIYDHLSAHLAYVIALYRHRPAVIESLKRMIAEYTGSVTSGMGVIGRGARVVNCRIIRNVKIGPGASVEGAQRLENGSINSCADDPATIGPGVFAEDFIACSGSTITDGTIIYKCFVGQGTVLSRQYSAENSVFFANCGGFHGEACAVFAGPYTVTHHKSTLLISGLFSFLNAGSGTNQSNHMYKLGPVHQGVVERGSKTGSDSYMLWPAKVGPFTVVMGRHYRHSDTSDLPFSYLIEHEDESVLAPGVNLRSIGTVRDAQKWPLRDRRRGPQKLDLINFKLLSPYTVQRMINGAKLLRELKETSGVTTDYFTYHSVKIPSASLERGIRLYEIGIDKFLGNCLIRRLVNREFTDVAGLRAALRADSDIGPGTWVDLAGLLAPQDAVEAILDDIEGGRLRSLREVGERFEAVHESCPAYEWAWAVRTLQERLGKDVDQITVEDVVEMIGAWKDAVEELDRMLEGDACKEFAATAQIGYGVDGDRAVAEQDFQAVRGTPETNSLVLGIRAHIREKHAHGDELISKLHALRR